MLHTVHGTSHRRVYAFWIKNHHAVHKIPKKNVYMQQREVQMLSS